MLKKSGKSRRLTGWVIIACLFSASHVFALSVVLGADDSVWSDSGSWQGGVVPGAADTAFIRNSYDVTVNSDVGSVTRFYVGDTSQAGTVNITSGSLVSSAASEVGRRKAGAYGELNISGGTFSSGAAGETALLVGSEISAAALTTGLLEISGTGTFFGRAIIGSTGFGSAGDIFRIVGSDATVGTTSTAGSNSIEVRESGSVEWVFDAAGISTVTVPEVFTFAAGSAGIIVDGSAYTGGANTFTLLNAGVISSTAPAISLVGFTDGATYSWDSGNDVFKVTVGGAPSTTRIFKVPVGTSGDWNVATNWTEDVVPRPIDSTFVRDGRTVNVNTDVGSVIGINIGDKASTYNPTGTVNILSGTLVVSTEVEVGRRDAAGSVGTLNISGGTFQAGDAAGSLAVLIGADTGEPATGVLEVSGTGTFIGRAIVGSNDAGESGDIFRIVGSGVTVGNTSTFGANSLEFRDSGSLEFVFDASGISTASFEENVTFSSNSVGIVVDGSAYTGASQTFTLLTAGQIASIEPAIELSGFVDGAIYNWDSSNDVFTITVGDEVIPEIGTITIGMDDSDVIIGWTNGTSGFFYALQSKGDLVGDLLWSNRVTGIAGIDGSMSATTTTAAVESFYRVIVE